MKLIKVDTLLKHMFCFMALYVVADIQLMASPLLSSDFDDKAVQAVAAGLINKPFGSLISLFSTLFGLTTEFSAAMPTLIAIPMSAFLWALFYERHEQYHSLNKIPRAWLIFLFMNSILASTGGLAAYLAHIFLFITKIRTLTQVASITCLLPAILIKGVTFLAPCWIALQSGKALFKNRGIHPSV